MKMTEQRTASRFFAQAAPRFSSPKEILMCPPVYFSIEYQINPWMKEHINQQKAKKQWEDLKRTFESLGAKVSLLEPVKYLPDMVFTADQGAVYDHIFIKSNFRHKERQRESLYTVDWFRKRGFTIVELPSFAYFEGRGDLAFFGDVILIGIGFRTTPEAAPIIGKLFGKRVVVLQLTDPYFYHLDTALCVLPNNTLLLYEKAFDQAALQAIRGLNASRIISIQHRDARKLACNSTVYGNTIVMNKGCSPALHVQLHQAGLTIVEVDLSEFLKAGGGAHCLTWNGQ